MKVGTIEPIFEEQPLRKRISRRSGDGGPNRPNGDNGGGNGGDEYKHDKDFLPDQQDQPDKSKIVTWFLLLVVLMTFGGLIGTYIVISTNGAAEWKPFDLPVQVWISTFLIIASSISYHFAKTSVDNNLHANARRWFIATTVLGAAFISSQILLWLALANRGLYMSGNPYAGLFYILTAVHAAHVLGGIIALGAVLLRSWNDTGNDSELIYRKQLARSVGWYWHCMGGLWLVLLVLLGFWK